MTTLSDIEIAQSCHPKHLPEIAGCRQGAFFDDFLFAPAFAKKKGLYTAPFLLFRHRKVFGAGVSFQCRNIPVSGVI